MNKKHVIIFFLSVFFTLLLQAVFGGKIAAHLATSGLGRRFQFLSPQAPIVINRREEVRVSDATDVIDALDKVKSKLSALFVSDNSKTVWIGSLVNIAPEGVFVTSASAVSGLDPKSLYVELSDGSVAGVEFVARDPGTNIVFIKAKINGASPASLADSRRVTAGQRLIWVAGASVDKSPYFQSSFAAFAERQPDIAFSDRTSRTLGVEPTTGLVPGQALVDLSGEVVGVWDGSGLLPSSAVRASMSSYFSNAGAVKRPAFGFYYARINPVQEKLLSLPFGIAVAKPGEGSPAVLAGSPAEKSGLRSGDVITAIGNTKLSADTSPEELLEQAKPGEPLAFSVLRGKDTISLSIVPGVLK